MGAIGDAYVKKSLEISRGFSSPDSTGHSCAEGTTGLGYGPFLALANALKCHVCLAECGQRSHVAAIL
jgi:hypothetical protein